jgi:prephenate dehydrogenase
MGLAHFVALAAGSTLARSGLELEALDGLASTSFRRLLGLVAPILDQPSDLTLPIQTKNPATKNLLALFAEEVDAWRRAVANESPAAFESMLRATRRSLGR